MKESWRTMNKSKVMEILENDLKMGLSVRKTIQDDQNDKHHEELDNFIEAHRIAYRAVQKMSDEEFERLERK